MNSSRDGSSIVFQCSYFVFRTIASYFVTEFPTISQFNSDDPLGLEYQPFQETRRAPPAPRAWFKSGVAHQVICQMCVH